MTPAKPDLLRRHQLKYLLLIYMNENAMTRARARTVLRRLHQADLGPQEHRPIHLRQSSSIRRHRHQRPHSRRQAPRHRRPLRRNPRAARRLFPRRCRQPRRSDHHRLQNPRRPQRLRRNPPRPGNPEPARVGLKREDVKREASKFAQAAR